MANQTSAAQFFDKAKTNKVWEVAVKLSVPVVLAVGLAMVRNEVVDNNQEWRLEQLEVGVEKAAPMSIQDDVRTLIAINSSMAERLARIETKIENMERDRP